MNWRNRRVIVTLAMLASLVLSACNQREKISMGTDTSDYVLDSMSWSHLSSSSTPATGVTTRTDAVGGDRS